MKRLLLSLIIGLLCFPAISQTSDLIKYQAALRTSTGAPITSTNVGLRFRVLQGSPSGLTVYEEKHTALTSIVGIVNVYIGGGFDKVGDITTINWTDDDYFLRVDLDDDMDGSYTFMGTNQFSSVPLAAYSVEVKNKQDLDLHNDTLEITGNPNATLIFMDQYKDNTDDQQLIFQNDELVLFRESVNDTIDLSPVVNQGQTNAAAIASINANIATDTLSLVNHLANDGDMDASNEVQTLNLDTLSDSLSLSVNNSGISMTRYLDNTDAQTLSLGTKTGNTQDIDISGGNTLSLDLSDSDNDNTNEIQSLTITGSHQLEIKDVSSTTNSSVDLSPYLDNTDAQTLTVTNSGTNRTIGISGGNSQTFDINDNDDDPANEIQSISFTVNSADAWKRDVTLSGTGGTTFSVADNDNDSINELQSLSHTVSGTDRIISITNGTGTTIDVADNDDNSSNELQNLTNGGVSGTSQTINISSGSGVTFSIADNDNDASNEIQNLSDGGRTGTTQTIDISGTGATSVSFDVADIDNDSTNEIQSVSHTVSGNDRIVSITGGGSGTTINVADNDDDSSNEIQDLTFSSDTLEVTNNGSSTAIYLGAYAEEDQLADADNDTRVEVEASTDEDIIRFSTGGTERVTINGGSLGIGTTAPSDRLHVRQGSVAANLESTGGAASTAQLKLTTASQGTGTVTKDNNTGRLAIATGGADNLQLQTNTGGDFQFDEGGNTRLYIEAGGQVGVGTTSPTELLDVAGKTKTTTFQMTSGASNGYLFVSDASGNGTWSNPDNLGVSFVEDADNDTRILTEAAADADDIRFLTAGTERLRIDQSTNGSLVFDVPNESNVYLGQSTGANATGARNNVGLGFQTMSNSNVTGSYNIGAGYRALYALSTGAYNVGQGYQANYNVSSGSGNIGIGRNANYSTTTSNYQVGVGAFSNYFSTGIGNVGMGFRAGYGGASNSGSYNVNLGYYSGHDRRGNYNVGIGYYAGYQSGGGTGAYNVSLGALSGYFNRGSNNTFLGSWAGYNSTGTGTGNVFIGYQAGYNETGSNKLYIDNTTTATPLIWGDFNTNQVAVNGTMSVNTTTVTSGAVMEVNGSMYLSRGGTRTIGVPWANAGGNDLVVQAGGSITSWGSAVTGGDLILRAGNANISNTANIPFGNSVHIYAGDNVFGGIGAANRNGDIIFYGGHLQPERMRMTGANGYFGILTSTPSFPLHVNGIAGAALHLTVSDGRFKTDVRPVENPIATVQAMEGVSYNWNREEFPDRNFPEGRSSGFVAQDLQKVVPNAVHKDEEGWYGVSYSELIPYLVEAIKEQQKMIEELNKRIEELNRK